MTRTFAIAMTLIAGTALVLASVLPSEAGWRRDRGYNGASLVTHFAGWQLGGLRPRLR